jgi:prepilin-type N-terminal cleavage/methylation domain-containing protein
VTARSRDESGFTLVELLIAVVVLGVIVAGISAGFSLGLNTLNETSNRLAGSNDAQLLGTYLPPDVTSATEATTTGIACSGASNPQLELSDGPNFNVVYGVRTIAGGHQLERYDCTSGSVGKTTVVARNLAGASAVLATRIPASGTLTGASLTVTERTTPQESSAYVFTVTGTRRSS